MAGFAEFERYDAIGLATLVRDKQISASELLDAAIERVESRNAAVNAVVSRLYDEARRAIEAGLPDGPFTGVPFLLKDIGATLAGTATTLGSRMFATFVADHDSELVARYRRSGLAIFGKTNTPEFGIVSTTEPQLFGPTKNPWNLAHSPGGSSGGAAAAVASGMVPAAHGNDGGRTIRIPASCCGLFGLQPTRARTPMGPDVGEGWGGMAVSHAITRTVRDSAALLDATSGPDVGDPYWAPPPTRPFLDEVGVDPGRLRIGYTTATPDGDPGHPDCVAAAEHAARLCASLGHEVTETGWPGFTPEVGATIGTIITAAASWIIRYWIRRVGREPDGDEIEPLNRALWQAGERVTAAQWLTAMEDAQRFSRRVARFLTGFDAFLTPTMSTPPLPIGAMAATPDDPWRSLEISGQTVRYAGVVANLTGNPAMSVPLCWNDDGLPVGVHFLGRYGDEA